MIFSLLPQSVSFSILIVTIYHLTRLDVAGLSEGLWFHIYGDAGVTPRSAIHIRGSKKKFSPNLPHIQELNGIASDTAEYKPLVSQKFYKPELLIESWHMNSELLGITVFVPLCKH